MPNAAMAHIRENADVLLAILTRDAGRLMAELRAEMAINPNANHGRTSLHFSASISNIFFDSHKIKFGSIKKTKGAL